MLDQNTILQIINTSLPYIAASPVLIKFFDVIGELIKIYYTPVLTFKNGKAEVDVELYRKQQSGEILESKSFTLYEITKLKNFINTAKFAEEELEGDEIPVSDEIVDFDWVMRFFDAVSNISNEELQKLWGKVLAGEIKTPRACSLRTLDIIRNMSQKEAQLFTKICQFILISGDCYFMFSTGFYAPNDINQACCEYIKKVDMNYSRDILSMIECGVMTADNNLATDFKTDSKLIVANRDLVCVIVSDQTEGAFFDKEAYFLTYSGIELYNIITHSQGFVFDTEYAKLCFKEIEKSNSELKCLICNAENFKMT